MEKIKSWWKCGFKRWEQNCIFQCYFITFIGRSLKYSFLFFNQFLKKGRDETGEQKKNITTCPYVDWLEKKKKERT